MIDQLNGTMERLQPLLVKSHVFNNTSRSEKGASLLWSAVDDCLHYVPGTTVKDATMLSRIQSGLQFLWNSYVYAYDLSIDPWEFSVDWEELHQSGITCNDMRWMIRKGLVEHAYEVTSLEDDRRKFVISSNLKLSKLTCLIITKEGIRLLRQLAETQSNGGIAAADKPTTASLVGGRSANGVKVMELVAPKWDSDRRQLRLDATIIKEFKVPAPNQEKILAAFEEEHWPTKIDDPLPHNPDIVPQRRLHDTINSLNRRQRHRLIHFAADGLGTGILWKFLQQWHLPE